jgi:deoxyribose-phosphate aldolase
MSDWKRVAQRALRLVDLTSLNESDTEHSIIELYRNAVGPAGSVAAVCVYPRFVALAKQCLAVHDESPVRIATVVNFPHAVAAREQVVEEIRVAIADGADEIDMVFPFRALMAGNVAVGRELVRAGKSACASKTLKVIIESGVLQDPVLIRSASVIAIEEGADFIKTSTGKVALNATLDAARVMLDSICQTGRRCGFKAAGGIRTIAEVAAYLALVDTLCGAEWVTPEHVRFGASSLLANLEQALGYDRSAMKSVGY